MKNYPVGFTPWEMQLLVDMLEGRTLTQIQKNHKHRVLHKINKTLAYALQDYVDETPDEGSL